MQNPYRDLTDNYEDSVCNRLTALHFAREKARKQARRDHDGMLTTGLMLGVVIPFIQLKAHAWASFSTAFQDNVTSICQMLSPHQEPLAAAVGFISAAFGVAALASCSEVKKNHGDIVGKIEQEHDALLLDHPDWFPAPQLWQKPKSANAGKTAATHFKDYKI